MTTSPRRPARPTTSVRRIRAAAIAVGVLLGMAAGAFSSQVHAADAPAAPASSAAKAKVKAKSKAASHKKAVAPVPEKLVPLPAASPEQLEAAKRVLIGRYECEFDKKLLIDANDLNPGYFNIRQDKQNWVAKPVISSTGAVRLEDTKDNVLLIQILTKSMLLNTKTGHRLVDGCVHEVQRAAEEELRKHPTSSVFDTPAASSPN